LSRRVFTLSTRFWGLAKAFHVCESLQQEEDQCKPKLQVECCKEIHGWSEEKEVNKEVHLDNAA